MCPAASRAGILIKYISKITGDVKSLFIENLIYSKKWIRKIGIIEAE